MTTAETKTQALLTWRDPEPLATNEGGTVRLNGADLFYKGLRVARVREGSAGMVYGWLWSADECLRFGILEREHRSLHLDLAEAKQACEDYVRRCVESAASDPFAERWRAMRAFARSEEQRSEKMLTDAQIMVDVAKARVSNVHREYREHLLWRLQEQPNA